jgi:hypothetical protein
MSILLLFKANSKKTHMQRLRTRAQVWSSACTEAFSGRALLGPTGGAQCASQTPRSWIIWKGGTEEIERDGRDEEWRRHCLTRVSKVGASRCEERHRALTVKINHRTVIKPVVNTHVNGNCASTRHMTIY